MPHARSSWHARLRTVLLPAILVPAQLLLFGAFATYARNESEFAVSFWSVVGQWWWAFAGAVVVLTGLGLLLRGAAFVRYVSAVFAVGVLLWVQGNFLVADYGPLYGEALDLGRNSWRAPLELGAWLVVVALALYFARRVFAIAALASGALIALQTIVLAFTAMTAGGATEDGESAERTPWRQPPDAIYQLSRSRNAILVVLDGFLSEVFAAAAETERAVLDRDFPGFVFFPNHLGAFPTTRASMPAMLSGATFRNDQPFNDFLRATQRRSIFSALSAAGYRVSSVTFHSHDQPRERLLKGPLARYNIPTPYGTYEDYLLFTAAQIFDLTLFRHVPHGVKSWVYNNDAWLAQSWSETQRARSPAARRARPSNHVAFVDEFTARMSPGVDEPVFLFLHVAVPHPPVVMDADCSFIGQQRTTPTSYAAQARCGIRMVSRFLDRLRALDLYDRSTIVLTADHGWPVLRDDHPFAGIRSPAGRMHRVVPSAMPLLAVKPYGRSGPLQVSMAPTSITDIAATILDLEGLTDHGVPGRSVFGLDPEEPRERAFAFHTWANADWRLPYLDVLHEFAVNGRVLDPEAWRFRRAIFEPTRDWNARLAGRSTGLLPVKEGPDNASRIGEPHVATYAPPDARVFTLQVARLPEAKAYEQTLTVRVDGEIANRQVLADDGWHAIRVPLRRNKPDAQAFTIELLVEPPAVRREKLYGALYRDVRWSR